MIDDEETVRGLFRAILEPVGYAVVEAENGQQGIRCFRESPTDVVITDMYMPQGDGLEVIRQLRPAYPALKILAVSGSGGTENLLSKARGFGADAILSKPVGVEELRATMANLLDHTGLNGLPPLTPRLHGSRDLPS